MESGMYFEKYLRSPDGLFPREQEGTVFQMHIEHKTCQERTGLNKDHKLALRKQIKK
jgi:hypothetical protein